MIIPRIRFDGDAFAKMINCVFAENLQDLLRKVDYGDKDYEAGFLHTSTLPHEGICYYDNVWSRDGGRGLIELARMGFSEEALLVSRYFIRNMNLGDHWGRAIQYMDFGKLEIDGNALVLLGIYNSWLVNGKSKGLGMEFVNGCKPVINWVEKLMDEEPCIGLLPSISELSGNPGTPYAVYGIFGNYAMFMALKGFNDMAVYIGMDDEAVRLTRMLSKFEKALASRLISDGKSSLVEKGCWLNGIDGRDGRPYDFSEWDGTSWPVYHWTRQLPFIINADLHAFTYAMGNFDDIHEKSYNLIHKWMCRGKYFRKYGFVSNTGWTGMGFRHDETMCGYGQGFMTQAALMLDDINTYTKCLEGIARLAYDGNVVQPLTFEMNPWVMHECFNYENYEEGYDHTFGVLSEGRPGVGDYPGDEGNLVQAAEIVKALAIVAGVTVQDEKLVIMPRLPWMWDTVELRDYPAICADGTVARINFMMKHERWLRKCSISLGTSKEFSSVDIRIGPFPSVIDKDSESRYEVEKCRNGSWIWVRNLKGTAVEFEVNL